MKKAFFSHSCYAVGFILFETQFLVFSSLAILGADSRKCAKIYDSLMIFWTVSQPKQGKYLWPKKTLDSRFWNRKGRTMTSIYPFWFILQDLYNWGYKVAVLIFERLNDLYTSMTNKSIDQSLECHEGFNTFCWGQTQMYRPRTTWWTWMMMLTYRTSHLEEGCYTILLLYLIYKLK